MPKMTEPTTYATDPDLVVGRYLAVWSEPDPASRRAAIAGLWAGDGCEFVEGPRFQGHEQLCDRITAAYQEFVGSGRYTVSAASDVTRHDDIVTLTIQLTTPRGEIAWAARVFLLLDAGDLIKEDYQLTVKPLEQA